VVKGNRIIPRQWLLGWLHLEPLLAVILWGGVYPGVKLGLRDIPLLSFTYLRILLALAVLFAVSRHTQAVAHQGMFWKPVLHAGAAQAVFQLLLVAGLQWTTAGNSAILLATAPLLLTVWLACRGQEYPGRRQWYGLVLGFVGVSLIIQGGGQGVTWSHLGGDLLALGATAAWAWYGVAIGPLVDMLGPVRATGWTMVVAALCFTPFAVGEVWQQAWAQVSWTAWAGLIYGATGGMVIAMVLWGKAMQRWGATQTMLYVYLEPVSAVVIAAMVLGEALYLIQAVGAVLTLGGVGLASSRAS
jgi:drug/metabolite transporter (DMT)-like permease